jgi:integrase
MVKGGAGQTRKAVALTDRSLNALKPEGGPFRVPDAKCEGLAVRVATDGRKTFDCAYRIRGAGLKRLSLGRWPETSLEAARDRTRDLKKAARAGIDLLAEERAVAAEKAQRITVGGLIEKYCHKQVRGKLRTAKEIENRLKRALHPKLETTIQDIKRRDLRALFDEAAEAGHEREAEKRRQTIGAMFRWAVAQDYLDSDPTAGLKAYDAGTPRIRVLSNDEIRKLWEWLDADTLPRDHVNVMKLQLALGSRCGEIAGMMAEEVDTSKWMWVLPAARSKNGKERVTPIVGIARETLAECLPKAGPVFKSETGRPLTASHVGQTLLNRSKRLPIPKFCTHDLRRSFATALDGMGVSIELIAAIVGHESSVNRNAQTLVRHYLRTDKLEQKRLALEAWDRRLRAILSGEDMRDASNVLRLARDGVAVGENAA